jgi:ATP-dependent Clp protease ATP-binding subunit ClpC
LAQQEASRFQHDFVGTEHVLLGLLRLDGGPVARVAVKLRLVPETVRAEIEKIVSPGLADSAAPAPFTPRMRRALHLALSEAAALNAPKAGPEHMLLGLALEGDGVAARVLERLGIRAETIRQEILREMGPDGGDGPQPVPAV